MANKNGWGSPSGMESFAEFSGIMESKIKNRKTKKNWEVGIQKDVVCSNVQFFRESKNLEYLDILNIPIHTSEKC